jgi:hypothetical protein
MLAPHEENDGRYAVEERSDGNKERWKVDYDDRGWGIERDREASYVFENVESVALDDVLERHLNESREKTNCQVDDHLLAFLQQSGVRQAGRKSLGA